MDKEFRRILKEAEAALNKERERLNNDPHKPCPWEEITPTHLKPAVEHIHSEFQTGEWQLSMQIECGCYIALHPELATQPKFKGLPNLIKPELRPKWRARWETKRESERFHFWREVFADGLEERIVEPFNSLLRIGLAQQSTLSVPPVVWAKVLASNFIYSLRYTVPHLIKHMCDEQENRTELDRDTFDGYCSWVYWRAPRLIHMTPSGNTPYAQATAWQRENAEFTERLLQGLTGKMLDPARLKLDTIVGAAYVALASSSPVQDPSTPHSPATPSTPPASVSPETDTLDVPIKHKGKLPPRQTDLSQYMDGARLTERQRDCFSLRLEYGLTITAIAERLEINRKTVDEHIEAAKRKIDITRKQDRDDAKKARFNR
jgi:DNA-binding CsgD family transcriptional regulator